MNQPKQTSARAFRRTEAGRAALEDKNSGLSLEYRRILEQIGAPDGLRPLLSSYSKAQIVEWLGQLMTLCMIESGLETRNQDHLRFTGRFKVSELARRLTSVPSPTRSRSSFSGKLVEWRRIELPTFALRTRRSPS